MNTKHSLIKEIQDRITHIIETNEFENIKSPHDLKSFLKNFLTSLKNDIEILIESLKHVVPSRSVDLDYFQGLGGLLKGYVEKYKLPTNPEYTLGQQHVFDDIAYYTTRLYDLALYALRASKKDKGSITQREDFHYILNDLGIMSANLNRVVNRL